ncbi:hypothetical protein Shyhy02_57190 [Streptomyces hygroscopicus subsp. hygroscopicus]|nr:hypothetical protein Shyhy02_57190 [Streptomyces hygroscopicus subsp. hygroscopicus]
MPVWCDRGSGRGGPGAARRRHEVSPRRVGVRAPRPWRAAVPLPPAARRTSQGAAGPPAAPAAPRLGGCGGPRRRAATAPPAGAAASAPASRVTAPREEVQP